MNLFRFMVKHMKSSTEIYQYNSTLHSEHIEFKPFHQLDRDQLFHDMTELLSKACNVQYFWNGKPWEPDQISKFIDDNILHWEQFTWYGALAAYEKISGTFMGYLDLHHTDEYLGHPNAVEIGYIIDSSFQRRGYGLQIATFGYQYMQKNISNAVKNDVADYPIEMVATVDPNNQRSINILDKVLYNRAKETLIMERYEGRTRLLFFMPFTIRPASAETLSQVKKTLITATQGTLFSCKSVLEQPGQKITCAADVRL